MCFCFIQYSGFILITSYYLRFFELNESAFSSGNDACDILICACFIYLFWFALVHINRCCWKSDLTQQYCGWRSKAWHPSPMFFAFFCLAHNLRKPADFRWRTLLRLCWSRQLSSGRHSVSNAHSSCLLLPDAAYTWHHPPHCHPLSYGMESYTHSLLFLNLFTDYQYILSVPSVSKSLVYKGKQV